VLFLKRGIVSGAIADGDELPSRRVLSTLLGVNPNTIQKAYRQLEEEMLILSHSGAKSFVVLAEGRAEQIKAELLKDYVQSIIYALKQTDVSKVEALRIMETLWEEEL
ncbi:MAG: GntR family transcriptional regulator, partial [Angelakisella sp.]|nr:GntR family transcriptional regulator [Angelakisella sp.]